MAGSHWHPVAGKYLYCRREPMVEPGFGAGPGFCVFPVLSGHAFTTAALGIVLLGEKITMNFLIGAGLIVVGMIYTILGEMNDAKKGTKT